MMMPSDHVSVMDQTRFSPQQHHHLHAKTAQLIKLFLYLIQPSVNAQLARHLITELKSVSVKVPTSDNLN
jgi:hypothetical protein